VVLPAESFSEKFGPFAVVVSCLSTEAITEVKQPSRSACLSHMPGRSPRLPVASIRSYQDEQIRLRWPIQTNCKEPDQRQVLCKLCIIRTVLWIALP